MATLAPPPRPHAAPAAPAAPDRPDAPWLAPLAWVSAAVAMTDLVFFALIATVVPPLGVAALLTLVGLVLLRRRPRAGVAVLGVTSALMLLANLPFAVVHLAHPSSAIDFVHAAVGTGGRALAVVAAVGAWRQASAVGARRLGSAAVGLAAATVVVGVVAMLVSSGDAAQPGDVEVVVERAEFPDVIAVTGGEALLIDNRDLFRHTFTVDAADQDALLDVDLPAAKAARATVDLPPGSYDVICEIPGHEFMRATLEVR